MKSLFFGGIIRSPSQDLGERLEVEGQIFAHNRNGHDQVIDLAGRTIIPAFADGHAHPLFAGRQSQGPQVTGLKTLPEILEEVKRFADANPATPWISGGAYEAAIVEGGAFKSAWLDSVVSDRPVSLLAMDHHTLWVNTKALEIAGITTETKNPDGGTIARNSDGSPQGTLRESAAINLVTKYQPPPSLQSDIEAIRFASDKYLSSGVTFAQDSWILDGMAESYFAAEKSGALKIDMNISFLASPEIWPDKSASFDEIRRTPSKLIRADSVKFLLDGALSSGTAALLHSYDDQANYFGEKIWSDKELQEAVAHFDSLGYQLHLHAIGDAAIRQALDVIEADSIKRRPVIVHAQLIDPADLPRFANLGVITNFQPLWTYLDVMNQELILPRIGSARNNRQYQLRSLRDSGARIAFGSDWPVTSEVPLEALHVPVLRARPGSTDAPWNIEEAITAEESFDFYTRAVAYQSFREDERGELKPGMKADFLILDKDPIQYPDAKIEAVYKNGELIKQL